MKTSRRFLTALALSTFLLANPVTNGADIFGPASTIDYQGRLLDSTGAVLAPDEAANFKVQFRLYDAPSGGTIIWAEEQIVTVLKGQFSVRLGEGTPIPTGVGGANEGTVDHAAPGLPGSFNGKERYLGVKVVVPNQTNGEIQPRLAFLTSPFSFVAGQAQVAQSVNQPAGSPPSKLNIGAVTYASAPMTSSGTISANAHTVLVNSTAGAITAYVPGGTEAVNRQLLITKTDTSTNPIAVIPQGGGTINGEVDKTIYLKIRGESITIQNVGANDWWIVSESRDKTPVGTIIAYSSASVPAGYIACNGANPNKTEFPELVAALGTAWGVPADNTKFRVPDLRGAFLRGRDGGRGYDDDRNARSADFAGAATGDNVGSYEGDQFRSHGHGVSDPGHAHPGPSIAFRNFVSTNGTARGFNPDVADGYSGGGVTNTGASYTGISIVAAGGNETRPENYNVNYCIKY